jgi:hypothetical protein
MALHCEASPVISKYNLKKATEVHHYQLYQNKEISLIISGVGKAASAAASGYCHAMNGSPSHTAWLNIGMAGHVDRDLGTGFLVNKIHDHATQQTWFPSIIFEPPCMTDKLLTVDRPDSKYQFRGGVDMEASGFYSTASRFTTSELIQCYKIVSDNQHSPVKKISAQDATDLIKEKMEDIDFLVEQLLDTSHELTSLSEPPAMFNEICDQIKLTHTERLQVKDRLRKLHLLDPGSLTDKSILENPDSSEKFLATLDQKLAKQKIRI